MFRSLFAALAAASALAWSLPAHAQTRLRFAHVYEV